MYGFFGTVMQRRIELAWKTADTYRLGRKGEIESMFKTFPELASRILTHVIIPIVIEEAVTGLPTEDKRGLGTRAATALFGGLAQSILYVRDVGYAMMHHKEPQMGMIGTPFHDIEALISDVGEGKHMFTGPHAGKLVGDAITVLG